MIDYYFTAPSFENFKTEFSSYWDNDDEVFFHRLMSFDTAIPVVVNDVVSSEYHVNIRVRSGGPDLSNAQYLTGSRNNATGEITGTPVTPSREWF